MAVYSDLDPRLGITSRGDISVKEDLEAVYASIENIIMTSLRTRVFRRQFGGSMETLLFEPVDEKTAIYIQTAILSAINKWDRRPDIKNVIVRSLPDENAFYINVSFIVEGLDYQVGDFEKILQSER